MKACPFRLMGVKGEVTVEGTNGGDSIPLRSVQCLGELCALYREHAAGVNKVAFDCAFVAAGTDAFHLREQVSGHRPGAPRLRPAAVTGPTPQANHTPPPPGAPGGPLPLVPSWPVSSPNPKPRIPAVPPLRLFDSSPLRSRERLFPSPAVTIKNEFSESARVPVCAS